MSHGLSVVGRKEKRPKQCCLVNFFGRDGQPQRGQKVGDILRPYYFLLLVVEEAEGVLKQLLIDSWLNRRRQCPTAIVLWLVALPLPRQRRRHDNLPNKFGANANRIVLLRKLQRNFRYWNALRFPRLLFEGQLVLALIS